MTKIITPLLLTLSVSLSAQTPYLVKDINTTFSSGFKSSTPQEFAAFGGRTYFVATTDGAGTELWSTDGTSGGTSLVADIIPGSGSSNPANLAAVNGVLTFNARDVDHGVELWATDGTAAGTHMITDISPGPNSSQPGQRIIYKNTMLFGADDGTHGRELWITDGTAAGTNLVKDINPGSASSSPSFFVQMGGFVYFFAGGAIWRTDGTDAGTVKAVNTPGRLLTLVGSQLFFEGFSIAAGWEPYVTDGTDSGTHMIADIDPGPNGSLDSNYEFLPFTALGNRVLFLANDGVHGRELWVSDGTAAGTQMVRDFTPGPIGTWDSGYAYITTLGNRAFFSGFDATHGHELWVTDGTDAGTQLFADLVPGSGSSFPQSLIRAGDKIYFGALSSAGDRPWVTDGTVAGTHPLGGTSGPMFGNGLPILLWPVGSSVWFAGFTTLTGTEPWVSDGTDAGTHIVANLAADQTPSSTPYYLTASGNLLFFDAIEGFASPVTGVHESSLWRTDGTEAGTFKLLETGQHPDTLTSAGSFVFFNQTLNGPPYTFMMSDGTAAGTQPASAFISRFGSSKLGALFPFADALYATIVDQNVSDTSLWKTTAALNAPATRLGALNPLGLIDVGGRKYFWSQSPGVLNGGHFGLWTTDGTLAGTYAIIPDLGSLVSQRPGQLTNAEGTLFFVKTLQSETTKLWKSDGTFAGTTIVKDLGTSGSDLQNEVRAAGRKVFVAVGSQLWVSDGTAGGTIQLANNVLDINFTSGSLRVAGNRVVWMAEGTGNVDDLWGSDGTAAGTQKLASGVSNAATVDDLVYFAATDSVHGTEIWTTDGTVDGTKLFYDLNPGPASSNPYGFIRAGNLLYFAGYTDAVGTELWALPLTRPSLSIGDARVAEGDTGTTPIHFTVALNPAASAGVTVNYATTDGTAAAGSDYDATSGTLTFAPDETSKSFDVVVHGNTTPQNSRVFYVTLSNATNARIVGGDAGGVIEDDDQTADLSLTPFLSGPQTPALTLANNGPRGATDIGITIRSVPAASSLDCPACSIQEMASGSSLDITTGTISPVQQLYYSATVAARQRDPQPSNNTTTWTVAPRGVFMSPAFLTTGASANVSLAVSNGVPPIPFASDATVISVPSSITNVTNHIATFAVTGLKPGTSTIDFGTSSLLVTVVAPGTTPRYANGLSNGSGNFLAIRFDQPLTFTILPNGYAPGSGATPTGTVSLIAAGTQLVQRTINATAPVNLTAYMLTTGAIPLQAVYSGDSNFLPQTINATVTVQTGNATLIGILQPVAGPSGTYSLTITATGSPVQPPSGTVKILSGSTVVGQVQLTRSGANATAQTTVTVTGTPTLTVNYAGDALYAPGAQQVRMLGHGRAAHH